MRDDLPGLYRSLEKSGREGRFDAIALAAAASFAGKRRPSAREGAALERLIAPLWTKLSSATRGDIAERLSESTAVPPELDTRIREELDRRSRLTLVGTKPAPQQTKPDTPRDDTPRPFTAASAEDARLALRLLAGERTSRAAKPAGRDTAAPADVAAQPSAARGREDGAPATHHVSPPTASQTPEPTTILGLPHRRFEVSPPSLAPQSADLTTPLRATAPRRPAFGRRHGQGPKRSSRNG